MRRLPGLLTAAGMRARGTNGECRPS
jgi:hypothetical protein